MLTRVLIVVLMAAELGCGHAGTRHGLLPSIVVERSVWCGPGWTVRVFPDGRVEQEVTDTCIRPHESHRTLHLLPHEIRNLDALISEVQFFTLPERLEPTTYVTDEDQLYITVWRSGQEHKVRASGIERLATDEARRFLVVWSSVVEAVGIAER